MSIFTVAATAAALHIGSHEIRCESDAESTLVSFRSTYLLRLASDTAMVRTLASIWIEPIHGSAARHASTRRLIEPGWKSCHVADASGQLAFFQLHRINTPSSGDVQRIFFIWQGRPLFIEQLLARSLST